MNLAVVVEIIPFTLEDSINELVEVEMVRVFAFMIVVVDTMPFTFILETFPILVFCKLVIIDEVATTPFTVEVKVFPVAD